MYVYSQGPPSNFRAWPLSVNWLGCDGLLLVWTTIAWSCRAKSGHLCKNARILCTTWYGKQTFYRKTYPPWKFNSKSHWKNVRPKKGLNILFQPSFLRGELAVELRGWFQSGVCSNDYVGNNLKAWYIIHSLKHTHSCPHLAECAILPKGKESRFPLAIHFQLQIMLLSGRAMYHKSQKTIQRPEWRPCCGDFPLVSYHVKSPFNIYFMKLGNTKSVLFSKVPYQLKHLNT